MWIVKARELVAVCKYERQSSVAGALDSPDGLTQQLHEVRLEGWDRIRPCAYRESGIFVRVSILDGDPYIRVEVQRDLILIEANLF